ncbi:MAG TPA: hypothetical protein ACFYEA_07355 [Candidatus Tripitaka californicus]|uniref:hypothetical protein n=3 Tax=Candidatus Tripitaka californicus TaxID=3367616 RepID=UPI004026CDB4|nr:hypothetical protein [Planctomycetota bacterium]
MKLGASYFGSRHLEHVRRDMEAMAEAGCNSVVHTLSEEDMTYYPATMAEVVRVSKEVGLEVFLDPWGVGRVFGGETFSEFVSKNPHCRQTITINGSSVSLGKACLNSHIFKDFMRGWIKLAAGIGADGIFWDEPHLYYGELMPLFGKPEVVWACTCQTCQRLFLEEYRHEMPADFFNEEVKKFRQDTILRFIGSLCKAASGKGLKNALCIFPTLDPRYGVYEWEEAVRLEGLDVFGTDPYWLCFNKKMEDFVRDVSRTMVALCAEHGREPQIWIQGFRVPAGREEEVAQAIKIAYGEGVRNIAVWSFQGSDCMSYLRSERPEVVWQKVSAAYRELRVKSRERQP